MNGSIYKINTHCQSGESVFDAAERVLGNEKHVISLTRTWENYVVGGRGKPLPRDVPENYEFAGFVTVRPHETFPVFTIKI